MNENVKVKRNFAFITINRSIILILIVTFIDSLQEYHEDEIESTQVDEPDRTPHER